MAFKKVTLPKVYHPYKDCKNNEVLCEGIFTKQGIDQFGGSFYEVTNEAEGVAHVLNSAGQLNYLMSDKVNLGDCIRVTYLGKEELTRGKFKGKESHKFDIEIDDERKEGVTAEPVLNVIDSEEVTSL